MLALVAARGGIFTFSHLAQRTIKWIEYLCCAANATAPTLPPLPLLPLPAELETMASVAHQRSMTLLPREFSEEEDDDDEIVDSADDYYYYGEISTIVRELHIVSFGSTLFRGRPVATVIDDVEHRLLEELVRRQKLHQLHQRRHSSPHSPASVAAIGVLSSETVYDAVLLAAHVYIWAALNPGPKEMAANSVFSARLRDLLDVSDLVERWPGDTTSSMESLLWVLFMGWGVSAQQRGDVKGAMGMAMWYAARIFETMEAMGVRGEEELSETLKAFPWVDDFCRGPCGVLWNMYVHRDTFEDQYQS